MECCICFSEIAIGTPLVPCGHDTFCNECAKTFASCPICRDLVCIFVEFKYGLKTVTIQVDQQETCEFIKKLLQDFTGVYFTTLKLVYGGCVIPDDATFSSIGVVNKSRIHIELDLRRD